MILKIWAWIMDTKGKLAVPTAKTTVCIAVLAFVGMVGVATVNNIVAQEDVMLETTIGDVNCDTVVDSYDVVETMRYIGDMIPVQLICAPIGTTFQLAPPCMEDEVVVGTGDFNSDGYWDRYVCDHPDNIAMSYCDSHVTDIMWDAIWGLYYGSNILTHEELQHWFAEQSRKALSWNEFVVLCSGS